MFSKRPILKKSVYIFLNIKYVKNTIVFIRLAILLKSLNLSCMQYAFATHVNAQNISFTNFEVIICFGQKQKLINKIGLLALLVWF